MLRRNYLISLSLPLAGVLGVAAVFIHKATTSTPPPAPPPSIPVIAASVLQHDVPIYLRGVGTVIAYNNVVVRSQITGQLVKVVFTQGQTVKKGDLLAEI